MTAANDQSGASSQGRSVGGEPAAGERAGGNTPPANVWRVVSASVQGRSHRASGTGNQDAVATAALAGGGVVLALADGAGSAERAGEGARLVVEAAVQALQVEASALEEPEPALRRALAASRHAVARRSRQTHSRPRAFAATLLLAALREDTLAILQVGDGAAIGRRAGLWRRLAAPHRGRHAGETLFATSPRSTGSAHLETLPLTEFDAVALLSDGLEPVATVVATGEPHAPFFEPLCRFAAGSEPLPVIEAKLSQFLASERLQQRSADDLSLILALRP